MGSKLKVGVIGIGSLGKEHARVYSELEAEGRVEFAGVYDVSAEALRGVSEKLGGVNVFTSQEELVERGANDFQDQLHLLPWCRWNRQNRTELDRRILQECA